MCGLCLIPLCHPGLESSVMALELYWRNNQCSSSIETGEEKQLGTCLAAHRRPSQAWDEGDCCRKLFYYSQCADGAPVPQYRECKPRRLLGGRYLYDWMNTDKNGAAGKKSHLRDNSGAFQWTSNEWIKEGKTDLSGLCSYEGTRTTMI